MGKTQKKHSTVKSKNNKKKSPKKMSQPEPESTPDKEIPKENASSTSRDPLTVAWEAQEKVKAAEKSSGKSFNAEPHPKAPALAEELSDNPKQDESGPKKDEWPPPINTSGDIGKARGTRFA